MTDFILEAEDLEHEYPDGTRALKGVSLAIPRGKKVAILGANGAGKSTLFLHFNGILRPTRGKIRFAGQDVTYSHSSLIGLRQKVGIVFQDPDSQLFSAGVFQEISFGPLNLGLTEAEVRERVQKAMEATGTTELQHKPTHFLSLGQKKRVAIAGIVAMEPEVIIFDEPTAWLDPKHAAEIMEFFVRLNQEGKTVILSTHDVDLAFTWADYIYVVNDGRVLGEGSPQEVFLNEELLYRANLTKPWLVEVYEELQNNGLVPPNLLVPRNKKELFMYIRKQE